MFIPRWKAMQNQEKSKSYVQFPKDFKATTLIYLKSSPTYFPEMSKRKLLFAAALRYQDMTEAQFLVVCFCSTLLVFYNY